MALHLSPHRQVWPERSALQCGGGECGAGGAPDPERAAPAGECTRARLLDALGREFW